VESAAARLKDMSETHYLDRWIRGSEDSAKGDVNQK
jgi:hypothetical protein